MILLIDGNAFINVAISVTKSVSANDKRTGDKYWVDDLFNDGQYMLKEHIKVSFRNFCLTYLNSLCAPVGHQLNGVHVVFDSKSWRKEYASEFFENRKFTSGSAPTEFKYKGSRLHEQQHHLFFDFFQKNMMPTLEEKCGVQQYRVNDAEGDDLIAYLCGQLNDDILIYSVDQDLKQLLHTPGKNVLLMVPKQMSKTKRLFVPETLVIHEEASVLDDFFSLSESDVSGSTIEKLISTLKGKDYKEIRVNPTFEILSKILGGDKSDEIPKITGVTPKKMEAVISAVLEKFGESIIDKIDSIAPDFLEFTISEIAKVTKAKEDALEDIRDHLNFNIKIIRLTPSFFPEPILSSIKDTVALKEERRFNYREFTQIKNNPNLL